MTPLAVGLLSFLALASGARAPQTKPAPATNIDRLGPQAGEMAPDFSATDQDGRTRTLGSILGPKGAMLVFYRSADW